MGDGGAPQGARADAAAKRAGEVGRALARVTSIRELGGDPYEQLEGSLIYAKESADITYALQISEASDPDTHAVFCAGVFRGSVARGSMLR